MIRSLTTLLLLLGTTQEVDNPQFKYWSGYKPESWLKMKMEGEHGGKKITGEMTYKLVELKDGLAIVEASGKSKVGERQVTLPTMNQEIKAKESADKFKIEKEGDEEIEIAGKKLPCHWYEFSVQTDERVTKTKAWMSREIPGGMAKLETHYPGASVPSVATAVEWEKK